MPEDSSTALAEERTITMYATRWCGDCRRARRWLDAHGIAYEYIDIDRKKEAAAFVVQMNNGMRSVPTLVFPDGSVLVEPGARELAAKCFPGEEKFAKRKGKSEMRSDNGRFLLM